MSSVSDKSSLRGQVVEYETYIDRQIAKTSFHVKLADVISGLVLLGLVLLGSLLLLVIVDHWIVGLNYWARLASLAIVLLLGLGVLATRVAPALICSINPTYAAQTLERAFPGLNNGLVNFLFFRERPDAVRRGIYKGMEKQAAAGLADVPIDSAVDRGDIIRLGYGLVALAAVWCAYILFSPKNPFQTISRVITPWREISRPSQVDIVAVNPGDVDIFRGQTVVVTAEILDLQEGQLPLIEFSTQDGQVVAQQIPLASSEVPGQYQAVLTTGDNGIQQDLAYRVVAGDAVSRMYQVAASLAPHIGVDRLQYDFPAYTQRPGEMVEGEGDIKAIEGTTVTIFGKANQPIRSGYIELIQQIPPNAESDATPTIKTAPLTVRGDEAEFRFRLRLDSDRVRSVYSSYRLRFVNEQQIPSQHPVTHSMEVIPDLRPVVKILSPPQRTVQIPENGRQQIDLRALDPDYELTSLQLAIRTRTEELVRADLISEPRTGQVVASFDFVPLKYGLKSGDVVQYEGVAKDNRHAALTGQLEPNQTISSKQYFRITPADPLAEREPQPEDKAEQTGDPNQENTEREETAEQPTGGERQPKSGETANDPNQQPSGESQEPSQGGDSQDQGGDPQESPAGEQGSESGLQQDGTSSGEKEQRELDSGQAGDNDGPGDGSSKQGGDQAAENNSTGEPSTDPAAQGEQPAGNDGTGAGDRDSNARGASADEPLDNDGTRDGEVVERIQDYLRDKGQLSPESNSEPGSEGGESAGDGGQQNSTRPDDGTADGTINDDAGPTETVTQDEATISEDENKTGEQETGEQTSAAPESGETGGDPNQKSSNAEQGDQQSDPRAADEQAGSKNSQKQGERDTQSPRQGTPEQDTAAENSDDPEQGTGSQADEGRASDQPGDPGPEGDRHTDAANQADQPGPSPSDGAQPRERAKNDPSQQPPDMDPRETSDQDTGERTTQQKQSQSGDDQDTGDGNSQQEKPQSGDGQGAESPSSTGSQASDKPSSDASSSAEKGENGKSAKASKGNPAAKGSLAGQESAGGSGEDLGRDTGDDANLEHAKQATDMVLEYLRDQQQSADPELLEKLGWTPDDVSKFLKRWDQLKQNARAESGKQELNDALRSMGLPPRQGRLRRDLQTNDKLRGNRESGRRVKPPSDVVDQYRAFLRSLQQTERQ